MSLNDPCDRVRCVLVRPYHPGNVGGVARALKTMGFGRLALVEPAQFPHEEAVAYASRADDVLSAATVHATLSEALAGTELAFAFTARSRDLSHAVQDVHSAMTNAADHLRTNPKAKIALVFGNETYGLSNAEVMLCNRLATIPANPVYSSLNLAASVQIAAYELAQCLSVSAASTTPPSNLSPHEEREGFYAHLERAAVKSGFLDPAQPKRMMERMRRLFSRADLEREEVAILRGLLAALAAHRASGKEGTAKNQPADEVDDR